jgi:hypothetical protein
MSLRKMDKLKTFGSIRAIRNHDNLKLTQNLRSKSSERKLKFDYEDIHKISEDALMGK